VTPEVYDQVQAKLDLEARPPEGLIVHTAGFTGGNMIVFDVWESGEAFERFANERLHRAIEEVSRAAGGEPQQPRREIFELHDFTGP
jgi:heme-degrading monooxygenase HmoA